jgi:hypothetical protein
MIPRVLNPLNLYNKVSWSDVTLESCIHVACGLPKVNSFAVRVGLNSDTVYKFRSLAEQQRYEFWVRASTIVGEGEGTHTVQQFPNSRGMVVMEFCYIL